MRNSIIFAAIALLFTACQQTLEERAEQEAKTYTQKNCPMKLSENIMLDSMTFDAANHTFGYHYHMSGYLDSDSTIAANSEEMVQQLRSNLKNLTSVQTYKEAGYNFHYLYRSQSNPDHILLETTFTKEDY